MRDAQFDTNTLMHYRPPTAIPWRTILKAARARSPRRIPVGRRSGDGNPEVAHTGNTVLLDDVEGHPLPAAEEPEHALVPGHGVDRPLGDAVIRLDRVRPLVDVAVL